MLGRDTILERGLPYKGAEGVKEIYSRCSSLMKLTKGRVDEDWTQYLELKLRSIDVILEV